MVDDDSTDDDMPPDPKKRADDQTKVLVYMVQNFGENPRCGFNPRGQEFAGVYESTWTDLKRKGFIERTEAMHAVLYRFTPRGWLAGMVNGGLPADEIKARAAAIRIGAKKLVKGRHGEGVQLDVRDFATHVALPVVWVKLALESNLLREVFRDKLMTVSIRGVTVTITSDFDLPDD